ncbi:autotransporter domain-containing protein [Thiosocius teredinicola]|uniref:autotransporter domain-containing protein n=1 Tax=Thiosocius teredinicola TaxID=1973002 RepID=UPI000990BAF8
MDGGIYVVHNIDGLFFETSAIALSGGDGDDTVINRGVIDLDADTSALGVLLTPARARLDAVGIATGGGADRVTNARTVNVDGKSTAKALGPWKGSGKSVLLTTAEALVNAIGIRGDGDVLMFDNAATGQLTVKANAVVTKGVASLTSNGLSVTTDMFWDDGMEASALATGVAGTGGDDTLVHAGTQSVIADADAGSLTVTGHHDGLAVSINTQTSTAVASGMTTGDGVDAISSTGMLTTTADAWAGALSVADITARKEADGVVRAFMSNTADAQSTAIDGRGQGSKTIATSGALTVVAHAEAHGVETSWTPESEGSDVAGWIDTLVSPFAEAGLDFVLGYEAGTLAKAEAAGILGGDSNDTVINNAALEIDAEALAIQLSISVDGGKLSSTFKQAVGEAALALAANGAALLLDNDAGDRPTAFATAIAGGAGSDIIDNRGSIRLDSDARASSTSLTLTDEGIDVDFVTSVFDAGTGATAQALGLDGGSGADRISNHGSIDVGAFSLANGNSVAVTNKGMGQSTVSANATASTSAISGGANGDALSNWGLVTARADSEALSVGLSATVNVGASLALDSVFDGGTHANATARGFSGGDGGDTLSHAGGIVDVDADAHAFSERLSGSTRGIAVSSTTSTAVAMAFGLDGGDGADVLQADSPISVDARSRAESIGMSLSGTGVSLSFDAVWDGGTGATSTAVGLAGGDGADRIDNRTMVQVGKGIEIDAQAISIGVAATIDIKMPGIAAVAVTSTGSAQFTGIDGGKGDDELVNLDGAEILVDVSADAASTSVAFSSLGVSLALDAVWDGGTRATALGEGLAGGADDDRVINHGLIDVKSGADTNSNGVAITGIGLTVASVTSTGEANAFGMRGDAGDDVLENWDRILVDALADAQSVGVSFSGSGVAIALDAVWDGGTTAHSHAYGMAGDGGNDVLRNAGSIKLGTRINTDAKSRSVGVAAVPTFVNVINLAGAVVTSTAETYFVGMDGGDGGDTIHNDSVGDIDIVTKADAASTSIAVTLTGVAAAADAVWDRGTNATARGLGLFGGDGGDQLRNDGSIDILAEGWANSTGAAGTLKGVATALISSTAEAHAGGMSGGDGDDTLDNTSELIARAYGNARSDGYSVALVGVGAGYSGSEANTTSAGIAGGAGADRISNSGSIFATAGADSQSTSYTFNLAGVSAAYAGTLATAGVVGIDGGSGKDLIVNNGAVVTIAVSKARGASLGGNLGGITLGFAGAQAGANPTGLAGGDDADALVNLGTLAVKVHSDLIASSRIYNPIGIAISEIFESRAEANAVGMSGGDGDDLLINEGTISIGLQRNDRPMTHASARNVSWTLLGAALNNAVLGADIEAVGIDGGDGADQISNSGILTVGPGISGQAMADVDVSGASWAFAGGSLTSLTSTSTSTASGLRGGDGRDEISNSGTLTVYSFSKMLAENGAETIFGSSDASADTIAVASAYGIDGGDGGGVVANSGTLTVNVHAENRASNNSDTGIVFGKSFTESTATTRLSGYGLHVGDGDTVIANRGGQTLTVTVTGQARTYGRSDGADIVNGDARAVTASTTTAQAEGISAGNGAVKIGNMADLTVAVRQAGNEAMAYAYADADGDGIDGDGSATATASAEAILAGIRAGNGDHEILNAAQITVSAQPSAFAKVTVDGDNTGNATGNTDSTATAHVLGISVGDGSSAIVNNGSVIVTAAPTATSSRSISEGWLGSQAGSSVSTTRATAIGIQTGSGDQVIVNTGTVVATAVGKITAASAVVTGSGNDDISNLGTLIASRNTSGTLAFGTAISSADGDDRVALLDGSITQGGVDLGSGNDTLRFAGTAIVTGPLAGGSGDDEVEVNGAGRMDRPFSGFEHLTKKGEGSFVLSQPVAPMSTLVIERGQLVMDSPYTFSTGGRYEASVYGSGDHSRFAIPSARLAGALTVNKGEGRYLDGAGFDIVTGAAGLDGGFNSVELPQATPLLSFDVAQTQHQVRVIANVESYTTIARNRTATTMGDYLDRIAPAASGDLALVLGELQGLSDRTALHSALVSLSPEMHDGMTRQTVVAAGTQSQQVFQRLGTLRAGKTTDTPDRLAVQPLQLAFNGSASSFADLLNAARQPTRQQGVWIEAFGRIGDQEADNDGFSGFDYDMTGITFGYDRVLDDEWIAGVSLGYTRSDVDFDLNRANGKIDSTSVSIYGSWSRDGTYVDGMLTYGNNQYEQQRIVTVGATDRRLAESKHDGTALSASLVAGFMTKRGPWQSGPYAAIHYAHIEEDGFTEHGAGGVSLRMDDNTTDSLNTELGLRARHEQAWKKGELVTELNAAWLRDMDIDDRVVSGTFVGAPGANFSLPGQERKKDGVAYGIGVSYFREDGVAATLRYRGETRDGFQDHALVGELRWRF